MKQTQVNINDPQRQRCPLLYTMQYSNSMKTEYRLRLAASPYFISILVKEQKSFDSFYVHAASLHSSSLVCFLEHCKSTNMFTFWLLFRNGGIAFRPPLEEVRAKYFLQIKRFLSIPHHFKGVSNTNEGTLAFASIIEKHAVWIYNRKIKCIWWFFFSIMGKNSAKHAANVIHKPNMVVQSHTF